MVLDDLNLIIRDIREFHKKDSEGRIYIVYPIAEMAEVMKKGR